MSKKGSDAVLYSNATFDGDYFKLRMVIIVFFFFLDDNEALWLRGI